MLLNNLFEYLTTKDRIKGDSDSESFSLAGVSYIAKWCKYKIEYIWTYIIYNHVNPAFSRVYHSKKRREGDEERIA